MLKRTVTIGVLLGTFMLLSTALFAPAAQAIEWGAMSASPDISPFYVNRYGGDSFTLTVSYEPFFFQYFPVWAQIEVVKSPSWLTVSPTTPTFPLQSGARKDVKVNLALAEQDVEAPSLTSVTIQVTGRIVLGGEVREVATAQTDVLVGVNPFTQITVSIAKPIERSSPDKELTFPVTIENWGTAQTRVTLQATDVPDDWTDPIISPQQIILDAKNPGDPNPPEKTVSFTVTTPHGTGISYHNNRETFLLQAHAQSFADYYVKEGNQFQKSSQDPENIKQATVYARMMVKNRGFYVPGFEAVILIGALAALAVVIRRRRSN